MKNVQIKYGFFGQFEIFTILRYIFYHICFFLFIFLQLS